MRGESTREKRQSEGPRLEGEVALRRPVATEEEGQGPLAGGFDDECSAEQRGTGDVVVGPR